MKLILYTDGASRGNPGPAALGVVLRDTKGEIVREFGLELGRATNNEAEYHALLVGLKAALECRATELEIRSDSDLMVAQLRGDYKIRASNLKPLFQRAKREFKRFKRIEIVHVFRESNRRADWLANRALNQTK